MAVFFPIAGAPIAGQLDSSVSATASGATVTYSLSVIAGTATGAATASGQTVTYTLSVIAGAATGAGTANGDTVTLNYSVIAGSASSGVAATANGDTVAYTFSLEPGVASGTSADERQPGGGYYRPPILVGGTKKRPPEAEPPLEISEEDLAAYLAALQAPGLAQARMQAALDEVKARILAEAQALEFQAAAAQALEAIVADEEENDLLLLAA